MNNYMYNIIDLCENCLERADLFCKECANAYCKMCSAVRHRQNLRSFHEIIRLGKLDVPAITTNESLSQGMQLN